MLPQANFMASPCSSPRRFCETADMSICEFWVSLMPRPSSRNLDVASCLRSKSLAFMPIDSLLDKIQRKSVCQRGFADARMAGAGWKVVALLVLGVFLAVDD